MRHDPLNAILRIQFEWLPADGVPPADATTGTKNCTF